MKKVFSIIALSAMTLSLSSFTVNNDPLLPDDDCAESAVDLQQSYLDAGYSETEAFQAAEEYYDFCISEDTPVLLP